MASKHECRENRFGVSHTLLRGISEFLPAHSVYPDRLGRNSLKDVWTYRSLADVSFVKIYGVNVMLCLSVCVCTYVPTPVSVRPSAYLSIRRNPWKTVLEKLVKRFPEFYRNQSLHCVHKSPLFVGVLSHINPLHAPHPVALRSILVLASHLILRLPSSLFTSCFPTKTLYIPVPFLMHTTCPAHLILHHMITRLMITVRIS